MGHLSNRHSEKAISTEGVSSRNSHHLKQRKMAILWDFCTVFFIIFMNTCLVKAIDCVGDVTRLNHLRILACVIDF